jgi:hypothetical protein
LFHLKHPGQISVIIDMKPGAKPPLLLAPVAVLTLIWRSRRSTQFPAFSPQQIRNRNNPLAKRQLPS